MNNPPEDPFASHRENTDLELDIISNTYRSIVDQTAFDDLLNSWKARLDKADGESAEKNSFSNAFLRQLAAADTTLDGLDVNSEDSPLERIVSEVAGPAVVLSPDLRVSAVNTEGTNILGARNGVFFDTALIDPASRSAFDELLRSARERGNLDQVILGINVDGRDAFHAEAFLVRLKQQSKPHIAIRTLELNWSDATSQKLRQAFGLSATEAEIGRLFFQTCNLNKIASLRHSSLNTVRTQMKTIQAKTGAANQADLIRLFSMVASRQLLEERGKLSKWRDPLGRETILELKGGRRIAWTWMGAEEGTPAVLLRGLGMGYLLARETETRLVQAGIKLYIPSRPGYGNSTLDNGLDVLDDNLMALRAFLDEVVQTRCVGIGMSDGIVPLLAEQEANPARFSALVAIGYTGILNRKAAARLPIAQVTMSRLAKQAPRLLELVAKLGHRMMQRHGVDWYLERAYKSMPLDLQTCRDPDTASLVRDACAHLLVQSHITFVRDMQLFHADVDTAIDRLTIPMHCLLPTEDGVFNLAEYQELHTRNALVSIEPVEGAADLLIYQKTNEVIRRVIDVIAANS